MNGVESSTAVSLNAAAVAFLYSFIQKAVKIQLHFPTVTLPLLFMCIHTLIIFTMNELVCSADVQEPGKDNTAVLPRDY